MTKKSTTSLCRVQFYTAAYKSLEFKTDHLSFLLFVITKNLSSDLDIRPTNKQTIYVYTRL